MADQPENRRQNLSRMPSGLPTAGHDMALRAGEKVGAVFEIEAVLQEVSDDTRVTYRAHDTQAGQWVEVMEYLPRAWATRREDGTLKPHAKATGDYKRGLDQFLKEATALQDCLRNAGACQHLASVRTVFKARGTAYMVTEHVEGSSLAEMLRNDGPQPPARVWRMLNGLTTDLAVAHSAGLVHGTIAPARVRVKPDGTPVLVGFGVGGRAATPAIERDSAALGDGYAALEQYTGVSAVSAGPWTDIHALGAVAYTALSERTPPAAPERERGEPVEPLAAVAPTLGDSGLASAIMAALALTPEARPSDLNAWRVQLGLAAPAMDGASGPPPFPKNHWWKVAAVAAVVVPTMAAAVLATQLREMQVRQATATKRIATLEDRAEFPRVQIGTLRMDARKDDSDIAASGQECRENPWWRGRYNHRVLFPRPFESDPEVMVAISGISQRYRNQVLRLNLWVDSTDTKGFNYSFVTWCDSRLEHTDMQWIAVAK